MEVLHNDETGNTMFDPTSYNLDLLIAAKKTIKNLVWSEIYDNLRKCRINVVRVYTPEYLTIPVYGKPNIAKNFKSVKQDWCKDLQVHQILEMDGRIKNALSMPKGKRPL